jgi:tripeptide aminopeptidase
MNYIVREHSRCKLENMLSIARHAARRINDIYGHEVIELDIKNQYNNMKEIIDRNPNIISRIEKAYQKLNIVYEFEPIRGGTDGAQLTFMGYPTPNIATGDYNCHGRFEYVDVNESNTVIDILLEMVKID